MIRRNTLPLLFGVIIALFGNSLSSQNCIPDSPINTSLNGLNAPALRSLLEQHRAFYQIQDVEVWKSNMARCQLDIDRELRLLESKASTLSFRYQDVLTYKDVAGLEKTIKDLEESEQKSRDELAQNLSKVKHTGIFVVLLKDIDLLVDKNKLIEEATQALSSRAIEDLNGTYIKRYTQMTDFNKVQDVIRSLTSGEVNVERELFSTQNFASRHFLYVGRIAVNPLKGALTRTAAPSSSKAIVLNLSIDSDYRTQLRAAGVRDEDLNRIEQDIRSFLPSLEEENKAATSRQQQILSNGNEKINSIQRDIEDAKRRLANRSKKIQELCTEFGVRFEAGNIDASVQNLQRTIRNQIEDLYKQWNQVKEREIVYRDTRHKIEGSPLQSIPEEVVKLVELMRSQHRSIQKMEERLDIENLQVSNYESKREIEVFREVDRVWAYLVPEADGFFAIYVFAKFRITEQRPVGNGGDTPEPARNSNMVLIKGGSYDMGDTFGEGESDEKPVHRVTVSDFYLSKYEVTFEEYDAFCTATNRTKPSDSGWGRGRRPAINVSWLDAVAYCNWLSKEHNYTPVYTINGDKATANWNANGYRLPTEAEWEYAARQGGQKVRFGNGQSTARASQINFDASSSYKERYSETGTFRKKTVEVGSLNSPNSLGLHDMSGNVREWCWDWYGSDYYSKSNGATNPQGPDNGSNRVIRGGSWDRYPADVRVRSGAASAPASGSTS